MVLVEIGATAGSAIAAFGTIATLPSNLVSATNAMVWNNNTGAAIGVYVDASNGTIRTRSNIAAGHLLLGQFITTPTPV